VLMLNGLATYLIGYPHLKAASARHAPEPTPQGGGRRRGEARIVLALTGVAAITVFQSIAYYQGANIGLIWIDRQVDPRLLGFTIPTAWYNSVDSLVSILFVPVLFGLWRRQARRGAEPNDLGKIAIGAAISMAGNLVLATASLGGGGLSPLWPVADLVLQGIAFLYYWPTLLALVSRAAPARLKSTLMGAAYLSLFASNTIIGRLGGLYETMTPTAFWLMHAAIAAAGAALAMTVGRPLKRILDAAAAES
jgi:POT family proton-dependent oligopeptide transporter